MHGMLLLWIWLLRVIRRHGDETNAEICWELSFRWRLYHSSACHLILNRYSVNLYTALKTYIRGARASDGHSQTRTCLPYRWTVPVVPVPRAPVLLSTALFCLFSLSPDSPIDSFLMLEAASAAACGEPCGWLAAVASMLAFGSFGVPIKSDAARSVDIDPLVFQSYKTFMCFATSWLILWGMGEEFSFTPWGIVSGLFWVPGYVACCGMTASFANFPHSLYSIVSSGIATVFAIKAAGLAIGIGIGSSFIVLVSFVWGIFVFQEKVHSRFYACTAILSMMLGLLGMSYYSAPVKMSSASNTAYTEVVSLPSSSPHEGGEDAEEPAATTNHDHASLEDVVADDENDERERIKTSQSSTAPTAYSDDDYNENSASGPATEEDDDEERIDHDRPVLLRRDSNASQTATDSASALSHRQWGMLAAAFCGIWGGSIMAPMKWCQADTKGTHYLMSFSIGASIVTLAIWCIRYMVMVVQHKGDCIAAYRALPSFHLRVMWRPGGLSGLLWSIGNFFSLISVNRLGEGVGYPLVQTSILVSGLWGIFYLKEVTGFERISKWLASSLLTIFGILLLSYEHHETR